MSTEGKSMTSGRGLCEEWVILHPRMLLRDDLRKGHPIIAINIPMCEKPEKLSAEELELMLWLGIPRSLSEAIAYYSRISKHTVQVARASFFERFIEKELVSIQQSEMPPTIGSSQNHLRIKLPSGSSTLPMRTPNHIYLELTQNCNLNCIHCFSAEGGRSATLPLETIQHLFRQMDELGVMSLTISGGEPTLHPYFPIIFEMAVKSRMGLVLLTNATRFENRGLLDQIIGYSKVVNKAINLGISLDGINEDTHDRVRRVKGSYRLARSAIEYLTKNGFTNISLEMIMCKHNIREIEAVMVWALERGIKRVILAELHPLGRGRNCQELQLTEKQKVWLLRKTLALQARYGNQIEIRLPKNAKNLSHLLSPYDEPYRDRPCCSAGIQEFAIRADGSVHPCSYIWADDFLLGNIKNKSLLELWQSEKLSFFRGGYSVSELHECLDCVFKEQCGLKECRAIPIMLGDKYGAPPSCGKLFRSCLENVLDESRVS